MERFATCVLTLVLSLGMSLAAAVEVKLTPEQQQAAEKLKAKGVSVLQLAADSDALAVNASLAGKQAGDAELELVRQLPKVTQLNLGSTGVTDAGLAHIAGLATLTHLHLDRTGITDAGLAQLKGLTNLTYLNLYSTSIGDAGLAHLAGLKNLRRVYLWQTKVTDVGANSLKQAIPELYLNRGEELAKPAPPAAPQPVNTVCPVLGKPADAKITFTYEGKVIAFCCTKCCAAFAKEPKKFIDKVNAAPAKKEEPKPVAVNTVCPVSGKAVDAQVTFAYEGKVIGFCCKDCCAAFAKEPKKFIDKVK